MILIKMCQVNFDVKAKFLYKCSYMTSLEGGLVCHDIDTLCQNGAVFPL